MDQNVVVRCCHKKGREKKADIPWLTQKIKPLTQGLHLLRKGTGRPLEEVSTVHLQRNGARN